MGLNLPRSGLVQQALRVDRPPSPLSFATQDLCLPLKGSVGHHLLFAVRASIRVTRAPPLHNLSGHAVCALSSNG